ncbi:CPBP family intramembrane glutamic endopeptidase [Nocardia sp. NPDC051570]|uniref:CPBP family intramembrane glutamic endopeptidase n=1 Tax=Nocardia sp. NPDC051570 TaxID=3364324 RepID=UPI00379F98EB
MLRARCARLRRFSFLALYAALLLIVVAVGLTQLHMAWSGNRLGLLCCIPLGALAGSSAVACDRVIIAKLRHTASRSGEQAGKSPPARSGLVAGVRPAGVATGAAQALTPRRDRPGDDVESVADSAFALGWVVLIAILEELGYRGLLLAACQRLHPTVVMGAAVLATLLWFGLIHLSFGWPHVAGKLPLGALALVGALVTGTVFTAVISHVWFNTQIWLAGRQPRDRREGMP